MKLDDRLPLDVDKVKEIAADYRDLIDDNWPLTDAELYAKQCSDLFIENKVLLKEDDPALFSFAFTLGYEYAQEKDEG